MKKSILNLGEKLTTVEQKEINGGVIPSQACDVVCVYGNTGRCGFPHCPGVCNGRGGYILY